MSNVSKIKIKVNAISRKKKYFLKGYIEGKSAIIYVQGYKKGHKNGLVAAWECARKITRTVDDGGFSPEKLDKIFGTHSIPTIMNTYSASEAMDKIREFEEREQAEAEDKE